MEAIAFVIWTLCWPIAVNLSEYILAKTKRIKDVEQSAGPSDVSDIVLIVAWVYISILLYGKI